MKIEKFYGMNLRKLLVLCLPFMIAVMAHAAVPAGRLAFVNDASASQDADDICAIPFQAAMMAAFDATDKLVHWSYNCDYSGNVITTVRMGQLETSLTGAIDRWGDSRYGDFNANMTFDCRNETQRNAGIAHLAARINESSASDPLWIIEAGEPDVIGYALEAATVSKRQFVKVVTHHTHNDSGPFWHLTSSAGGRRNISTLPGMAADFIVRIPDQNTELKAAVSNFSWMTSSTDPRIEFLEAQYLVSTSGAWNPRPSTVDMSDAGMVWFVLDGGPGVGDTTPSPAVIGAKITAWATAHPHAVTPPVVSFTTPSGNTSVDFDSDLYIRVSATSASGISQVALYKDNVLIRSDSSSPYEWGLAGGTNDLPLRNLQAGSFVLKAIATDTGAVTSETSITVTVQPRVAAYFSYSGGTGHWEMSGNWSRSVAWNGPFTGTMLLPSSLDGFTLGAANVTLNTAITVDDYRVGDDGASPSGAGNLALAAGSTLNANAATIGYNQAGTMTISAGAQLNHSEDAVVGYRGASTVDVSGTFTTRDLKLQFSGANSRAAASVINVQAGGLITVSRNLEIGGDDGNPDFAGLSGTLNIFNGGVVTAAGLDLRNGTHIVISSGGQLRIVGDQRSTVANYIASGYISTSTVLSYTFDAGETTITSSFPSGYDIWASAEGVGTAYDDDDGDGKKNLLEYATGGDPHSSIDPAPTVRISGDSLSYGYKKRNDDSSLTFSIQGSFDLKLWQDIETQVTIDSTDGLYNYVTHTALAGQERPFIKLKVTTSSPVAQ
jgi:Bacterial Ig domain